MSISQNINTKLINLMQKKICILGFGIENQALVEFLVSKKIDCEITICDLKKDTECPIGHSVSWHTGKDYDKNLDKFDIILRVSFYPLFSSQIKKAKKAGVEISSAIKLFFEICPTKNIIGVTGTKGKGTTASLIYNIINNNINNSIHTYFGGNIGIPVFSFLDKIKKDDWVVLELSSFQLEDLNISPKISVITNFSKEHLYPADPKNLNYHKTLKNYWDAKFNIAKFQTKNDFLILNKKLQNKVKNKKINSKLKYFNKSNLKSKLIGEHNKENIASAIMVAEILKIKKDIIKNVVKNFKGLEYRLQFIKEKNNIKYYNDSFATTPEATITALKSFSNPVIILLGGADKGSNFKQLAKIIKQKTKFVVLFKGTAQDKIVKELKKINYLQKNIKIADSMKNAMKIAKQNSIAGDIILLSPACASFGIFKNYKERGKLFNKEI